MIDLDAIESRAERRAQLRRYTIVSCRPSFAYEPGGDMVTVERDRTVTEYASETPPADADLALVIADARAHRARADAAEAERDRLRGELTAVRRAVRTLDGARAAIDAHGQRTLRSLAGEERAALLEELDVARRERDDWNALATAMEAERDYWREQATGMAPSVDGMRALGTRLVPGGTGCVVDPERVVAEVERLRERVIEAEAEASRWGDALVAIGETIGMPGLGSAKIVEGVRNMVSSAQRNAKP